MANVSWNVSYRVHHIAYCIVSWSWHIISVLIDGWVISCELALKWKSLDLTDDKSTLVQVMAWCHQATSHYLSQCWPRSLSPYGVTRPQWVKTITYGNIHLAQNLFRLWQHQAFTLANVDYLLVSLLAFTRRQFYLKYLSLIWFSNQ